MTTSFCPNGGTFSSWNYPIPASKVWEEACKIARKQDLWESDGHLSECATVKLDSGDTFHLSSDLDGLCIMLCAD